MNTVYLSLLFLFGFMGFIAIIKVALKPMLFWTMLILSAILGAGIMVNGYGLIDEYLVGCIIVGFLLVLSVRPVYRKEVSSPKTRFSKIHFEIFFLFMCYLTFQSIRGLIILDDLRMIRFILFFLMLGIISYILFKGFSTTPSPRQIVNLVLFSSLLYFTLYLVHGIYTELIRGINRFSVQGQEWSGSTVAMFPLFCIIPAVYFVLKKRSKQFLSSEKNYKQHWIAWAAVIVAIATSFYYDSRISWTVITCFLVLSFRDLGLLKSLKIFIIFTVFLFTLSLWILPGQNFIEKISAFYKTLFTAGIGLQSSDIGRKLEILASFRLIIDDPKTLLFGTGFYTERYTLVPYFIEVLSQYGTTTNITNIIRPATFSSFLVGTGLVGIFFLFLCFYITACEIITYTKGHGINGRKIVLFSLAAVFLSMFISINLDLVLFYFYIMPSGLLVQMSKYETSSIA